MHNFGTNCGCAIALKLLWCMIPQVQYFLWMTHSFQTSVIYTDYTPYQFLFLCNTVSLSANGMEWVYYLPNFKSNEETFMKLSESLKCAPWCLWPLKMAFWPLCEKMKVCCGSSVQETVVGLHYRLRVIRVRDAWMFPVICDHVEESGWSSIESGLSRVTWLGRRTQW